MFCLPSHLVTSLLLFGSLASSDSTSVLAYGIIGCSDQMTRHPCFPATPQVNTQHAALRPMACVSFVIRCNA